MPTILKFQYRFPYYSVVEGLYSRIPYVVFTGYTGYFVLGHLLANTEKEGDSGSSYVNYAGIPVLILLFLLFFNIGHLVCFYDSIRWGQLSTILNDPFSLTDFVSAGCIFLLVKRLDGGNKPAAAESGKSRSLLTALSAATLGVYILHPAVLILASHLGLNTLFAPQLISVPLGIAVVYLISLGLTLILKKVPGIRGLL